MLMSMILAGGCGGSSGSGISTGTGSFEAMLSRLRPKDAPSMRLRACALFQAGRIEQARRELLLSLVLDEDSAEGHRLLARVESAQGQQGAALAHLDQALRLDPDDAWTRQQVAALLIARAGLRLDETATLLHAEEAELDLRRAVQIDPSQKGEACRLQHKLEILRSKARAQGGWTRLRRSGWDPFRPLDGCPGLPRGLDRAPATLPPTTCTIRSPGLYAIRLARRYLLGSCLGAQLALALEARGCLTEAESLWRMLSVEAPSDGRFPFQVARLRLMQGEPTQADPLLLRFVYVSDDRAEALLEVSRLLRLTGYPRRAARQALEALRLARTLAMARRALDQMAACGQTDQARLAAVWVKAMRWNMPATAVEEALRPFMPPETPGP